VKRTRSSWFVVPFVIVFVVGACSGGDDDGSAGEATAGAGSVTPTVADTGVTVDGGDVTGGSSPGSTTTTTTTTTTTVPLGPPLFEGLDGVVTLKTPESGGGNRPVLEWDPFEGAVRYTVAVYAPDGRIYWSWATANTSIPVGGEPQLRADAPGPSVTAGMTWATVAYDADDLPIAVSEAKPIAP
jgi:hypothetical protein